jgi:hypothetical protein
MNDHYPETDYSDKWDNPRGMERLDPWENEDPFA